MQDIEKNEVNISKLFNWGGKLIVKDSVGNDVYTLWIRLIGDADINQARVKALRYSAELRKKLKTEDTDERLAYIPDFEGLDFEILVEAFITLSLSDWTSQISKDIDMPIPKEPDSGNLEEMEDYQKQVDEWPNKRFELIRKKIDDRINEERTKLQSLGFDEVTRRYEKRIIDTLCEQEMYTKFNELCTFYGTFKDESFKERAFSSYEEFINLPSSIKEQILDFYSMLDIKVEELKK